MKKTNNFFLITLLTMILLVSTASADLTLPGITAYYPFDTSANDVVGTNHGVVYGAAQTAGIKGNAFDFDGSNDYISLPRSVEDDFTIVFWVSSTQTAAIDDGQWYRGNGLVDAEVCGEVADFGTALLGSQASFGTGNPDFTIGSTSAINDGTWHQVAAVREKNSGTMKLYVDGNLEKTGVGTSNSLTASDDIYLGNNPCHVGTNSQWFQGKIDEVQIYSRVLTDSEILDLYNSIKNPPTAAPEFPSTFLPVTMIIGLLGTVLLIQRTRGR